MFTSRNVKKIFKYPRYPTKQSDLESVDSQICRTFDQQYSRIKHMNKYNMDFFYMRQCVLNRSSNQDAHYSCPRLKKCMAKITCGCFPNSTRKFTQKSEIFRHRTSHMVLSTFPGANKVQGKNTLGYLRTRTLYIPERKYAYKYASITKCLTYSPREM